MTPAARVATAIGLLDEILAGSPAERVLTSWARRNRYAGSRDREAVRDHVYEALRRRRSYAALGGGETGRGMMLGALRHAGRDPGEVFTGTGYAPAPLTPAEAAAAAAVPAMPPAVALDCPDWLWPRLQASLGELTEPVLTALRERAPLTVRVNRRKTSVPAAARALAEAGIETVPNPLSPTALDVTVNARAVQRSAAYRDGLVEVQDAASQAVADAVPLAEGDRVLDCCAGGGGKTLALAGRVASRFFAHDADPRRMADLPGRARRAGVRVALLDAAQCDTEAPFDATVVDAPCSGSGAWRRAPETKWTLNAPGLDALVQQQDEILARAAALTAPAGVLAYITCSLLEAENGEVVARFLAGHPAWRLRFERRLTPLDGGDGFYIALLRRNRHGEVAEAR